MSGLWSDPLSTSILHVCEHVAYVIITIISWIGSFKGFFSVLQAVDLEQLRLELEDQLGAWSHSNITPGETEAAASELWHRYEALTSSLSQDLCEQLRLVLEPSQATKLK